MKATSATEGDPNLTPDRRAYTRYDIIGSLWGVLDLPHDGTIVNASETGLLIEADVCPVLESVHTTNVNLERNPVQIHTVVRHFHPSQPGRFRIGLEFQEDSPVIRQAIERLPSRHRPKDSGK